LWFPKQADIVFEILYSIAFSFFIFDMMFNLLVEPGYFGFYLPRRARYRQHQPYQPRLWTCGIGSFLFWCDIVSTAALLYDISWINPGQYALVEHNIQLNDVGVPVSASSLVENLTVCCLFLSHMPADYVNRRNLDTSMSSPLNSIWIS
jgi:hypothetical protein